MKNRIGITLAFLIGIGSAIIATSEDLWDFINVNKFVEAINNRIQTSTTIKAREENKKHLPTLGDEDLKIWRKDDQAGLREIQFNIERGKEDIEKITNAMNRWMEFLLNIEKSWKSSIKAIDDEIEKRAKTPKPVG